MFPVRTQMWPEFTQWCLAPEQGQPGTLEWLRLYLHVSMSDSLCEKLRILDLEWAGSTRRRTEPQRPLADPPGHPILGSSQKGACFAFSTL